MYTQKKQIETGRYNIFVWATLTLFLFSTSQINSFRWSLFFFNIELEKAVVDPYSIFKKVSFYTIEKV